MKDLHELNGIATLKCNDRTIAQAVMPTHAISAEGGFAGTVLFRFTPREGEHYLLSVRANHVPPDLRNIEGTVKVETDPIRNKNVLGFTLLNRGLVIAGVICTIPMLYYLLRRRGSRRG